MAEFDPANKRLDHEEGFYDNDEDDPGGETLWGCSRKKHPEEREIWDRVDYFRTKTGFPGNMKNDFMLKGLIYKFRKAKYWDTFNGDKIKSQEIAEEICEAGYNCGRKRTRKWLQRIINVGNRNAKDYADIKVDGAIGTVQTIPALEALVTRRGSAKVVKALNHIQGYRYLEIAEARPVMEKYFWGWLTRT